MRGCRERISRQTDKLKSRQTINRMRVYNYFKGPFFICYLAASLPTLGQYLGDNLNQCQSVSSKFQSQGHQAPHNEIGSLSQAKRQVEFDLETLQFCRTSLTH